MAVFCPKCGTENSNSARFCIRCGAELVRQRAEWSDTQDKRLSGPELLKGSRKTSGRRSRSWIVTGLMAALLIIVSALLVFSLMRPPKVVEKVVTRKVTRVVPVEKIVTRVVSETVVVEKEVEKVVKETVVVEKEVAVEITRVVVVEKEKVVKQTVIVEGTPQIVVVEKEVTRVVEKMVTATPTPSR